MGVGGASGQVAELSDRGLAIAPTIGEVSDGRLEADAVRVLGCLDFRPDPVTDQGCSVGVGP